MQGYRIRYDTFQMRWVVEESYGSGWLYNSEYKTFEEAVKLLATLASPRTVILEAKFI